MKNIIVLGDKGMLGQMAVRYFSSRKYEVRVIKNRYDSANRCDFINEILQYPEAVIINAIGRIKQKSGDIHDLLWANAILPLDLVRFLIPSQTLIHPSTDCVFSGKKKSPYLFNDLQDATDIYGWSKQLGEAAVLYRKNTHIIRTSIIGFDNSTNPKGLLGWFLNQTPCSRLQGFTNHLWNGITTLEWCKYVEMLINNSNLPSAIHQLGTAEYYSKYEMLCLFNEIFETKYDIEKFKALNSIDRRLKPNYISKKLKEQLLEMKEYCKS